MSGPVFDAAIVADHKYFAVFDRQARADVQRAHGRRHEQDRRDDERARHSPPLGRTKQIISSKPGEDKSCLLPTYMTKQVGIAVRRMVGDDLVIGDANPLLS